MRRLTILLVLGLMAGSGCYLMDGGDALESMTLRVDRGSVQVQRNEQSFEVDDEYALQPGDQIETLKRSRATLRLRGEREAQLAPGTRLSIIDGASLAHQIGSVLAVAGDDITIRYGDVVARGEEAAFRVDRAFAVRTAAYRGRVEVRASGSPAATVKALFEISTAGDRITGSTMPYHLNMLDPWDQRFFGRAIALEQQLLRFGSGLESHLGNDRPEVEFFKAVAGRDVSFVKSELRRRSVSDLLIGFAISLNTPLPAPEAFTDAFALLDDGASWGIVASILDVDSKGLIAQLDGIVSDIRVVQHGTGRTADFKLTLEADRENEQHPEQAEAAQGEDGGRRPRPKRPAEDLPAPDPTPTPTPTPPQCASLTECLLEDLLPLNSPDLL